MLSKIKTFYNLQNSHKWIFIKIFFLVPLLELAIKTVEFKKTYKIINFFINYDNLSDENRLNVVRRHNNYINLYQKQFPFLGQCLARSMTLWFLMARKGIKTEIKFGMKKDKETLLAHAWVEHQGEKMMTELELEANYIPFNESITTKIAD